MTKNPWINAALAILYIVIVASLMYYGPQLAPDQPDNVIMPIAMISLFTLSAAIMGYLFLYQPLQLFLDGHKKEAASLFLKTVAVFSGITALILAMVFSGILS